MSFKVPSSPDHFVIPWKKISVLFLEISAVCVTKAEGTVWDSMYSDGEAVFGILKLGLNLVNPLNCASHQNRSRQRGKNLQLLLQHRGCSVTSEADP